MDTAAARALGWTLFHFLWEGIAIAVALVLVLLVLRTSRARYAAACLALGAMLAGCVVTFIRVLPGQARGPVARSARLLLPLQLGGDGSAKRPAGFHAEDVLPWVAPVWFAGVLLLHLRTVARWTVARRLCRSGVCVAPQTWQERLTTLAGRVGLSPPVALLESCRVDVPLVVGWLRPVILVPIGMLTGMPTDHVEALLLHELAHIRGRDYLVNLLQAVAENLLFYHPAVWWISGVIRTEREHCCDDLVVQVRGNAYDYALALTNLEENRWTGEPALAATGGNLMKRVQRLLDRPEPRHAALTPAFSATLVLISAAVGLLAWQPQSQQPTQEAAARASMPPYQKWMVEDVAYIISDEERAAFKRLNGDEEREHFIEQFWMRRDPTPGTPANEMKEEHYRRIAYTNERFTTAAGLPGLKTDRGRIYITYGPPDELESHPTPVRFEAWKYRHIDGVGDNVIIEFNDPAGTGEYRMVGDSSVSRDTLWTDRVKRGDMLRQVRGLGTLAADGRADIGIAETQTKEVRLGQVAAVDFRGTVGSGRVAAIDPTPVNGLVHVTIQLDSPPPANVAVGQAVDAAVEIELLRDVVYVGRPVMAQANGEAAIFKIDPDGQHAAHVPVRFGRSSVNTIEVVSGLEPGDQVIVSDMTPYVRYARVKLR